MSKKFTTVCDECHSIISDEQNAIQLSYGTSMTNAYDLHKECFDKLTPMEVMRFVTGLSDEFSVNEVTESTKK